MRSSPLVATLLIAAVPTAGFAQATVPESALTGPAFSLSPNQAAPMPPATGTPVTLGTPGALVPKKMGSAAALDPAVQAYVRSLQEQLPAHGYRAGPVSGRLDPATEKAILAYQRDAGITPDARSPYALQQTIDSVNFARPPIQAGAKKARDGGQS